jgi:hypothetical protein
MSVLRLVLGTFGATLVMLWLGAWSGTAGQSPTSHEIFEPPTATVSEYDDTALELEPSDVVIDRYGNQVERAVTDYRIDHRGDVYERHSPETALPRLARAES